MKSLKQLLILTLILFTHLFLFSQENVLEDIQIRDSQLLDSQVSDSESITENISEIKKENNIDSISKNRHTGVFSKINIKPYFLTDFPKGHKKKFNNEITLETSRSSSKGIFVNSLTTALYNTIFYDYGLTTAAVQLTEDSTSFLAENVFWFLKLYCDDEDENLVFRLGADLYFNYEYLNEISSKYIFLYGLSAELFSGPYLSISARLFAGNRISHIFLDKNDSPKIHNWDVQSDFTIQGKTKINLCPFFTISSFEGFRYPLFYSPIFTLGLEYISLDKFSLGISGSLRYIDAFTLSSYMDSWTVRIYAGYAIK